MSNLQKFKVSHVVTGDELGLIKKLEINSVLDEITSPKVTCINRDTLDQPSPDKAVLSIRRFVEPYYLRNNLDSGSLDQNENLFLICSKGNRLQLYNAANDELNSINPNSTEIKLSASVPFRKNFIVNCYANGSIYVQNIEKEMLQYASDTNKKALKVLGLDVNNNDTKTKKKKTDESTTDLANNEQTIDEFNSKSKKNKNKEDTQGTKKGKFSHAEKLYFANRQIYNPNLNTSSSSIECFELDNNYFAIGGKNHDLKVFNLEKEQCIFNAKPAGADWLGLTTPVYLSGIAWLGKYPSNLIATTTKTEPIIRVYDLRADGKAIMQMNMKEKSSFHSNPPVFSSICSTRNVFTDNANNHQLIVGSTVGRMIAIDLRLNTQTYGTLSSFKGFGGSIRDIKHIPETKQRSKIITCCLDRFVRVHTFETGFERKKELKGKYYLKTKLTCLQPIFTDTSLENKSNQEQLEQ